MTTTGTSEARFPNLRGNLSRAKYFLELAIIAATYFAIAETALLLPAINATATPLWPPTGLALSVILLRGDRVWPAILIGSIFATAITSSPMALWESDSNAIATTVAALAGAWLINRWSQGYKTLASPLNVARFGLISFVPTAVISSGIAIAAPVLANALGFAEKRSTTLLLLLLMLGAGFLFADGMITPAISVLSAVEGLHVAPPTLGHTVIPITIGLLTVLFAVQFKGTSGTLG